MPHRNNTIQYQRFRLLIIYSFFHSIQAASLILSVWMVPLELGSTQPVQLHPGAPIQQYVLGEYVPGTVLGAESRVVSKTDSDLALMELYLNTDAGSIT